MFVRLAASNCERQRGGPFVAAGVGEIKAEHCHGKRVRRRRRTVCFCAVQRSGEGRLYNAHAVAFPRSDASGNGFLLDMSFHRLSRQLEFEMHRLLFHLNPPRVLRGKSLHELVVPPDEKIAIGVQAKFLTRSIKAQHEANARFLRRHSIPGRLPGLFRHFGNAVVKSFSTGVFYRLCDAKIIAVIADRQNCRAEFWQKQRAILQIIDLERKRIGAVSQE